MDKAGSTPMRTFVALSLAACFLAHPLHALSEESGPIGVAMAPLEVSGDAPPEFVGSLSHAIERSIEADPRFQVVAGGGAQYQVKGHVYANSQVRFVGLQLFDTATGKALWSENYDYTNITTEMIADDLVHAIRAASTTEPLP